MKMLKYRQALKRLGAAFPELELCVQEQLEGVRAAEHSSRPCPCGHGRLAQWPWALQTEALGVCDCTEQLISWRCEWIPRDMKW